MKTLGLIVAIILFFSYKLIANDNLVILEETYYGISATLINTGSGHGMGYTINANVIRGRKSLEVGIIYSDKESKIAGGDFKYRIFLGNIHSLHSAKNIYTGYLQYNLVYRKGTSYSSEIITLGDATYIVETDAGTIATMGHYISYGNKVRILENFYLDASLGLGYYIGSLDKTDGAGTWGIHKYNGGFTYSFKIGLGYIFN